MHRAESILQAVAATLTGLPTTGASVVRGWAQQLDSVPGLIVRMGPDEIDFDTLRQANRLLTVSVEAVVRAGASADSDLNQIRAEVFAALMADRQLGLPWVVDTAPQGDAAPTQKDNADPVVRQVLQYQVQYRHSITSAEA